MTTKQPNVREVSAAEYVLPAPPRPTGEIVVVAPRPDPASAWRRGSEVARALGERFLTMVETQQIFATELRDRLTALDGSIAEASRAQWKGALRAAMSVLEWSEALQADQLQEARWAAAGEEPLDVADLCQQVAAQVQTPDQPVYVGGQLHAAWWGSAPAVAEVVRQALGLVGERTQGVGARSIEVSEASGAIRIAFAGAGEPAEALDQDSIVRFRRAIGQLRAVVTPDASDPGGAGLVVELQPPPPSS